MDKPPYLEPGMVVLYRDPFYGSASDHWLVIGYTDRPINSKTGKPQMDGMPVDGVLLLVNHDGKYTFGWTNRETSDLRETYEVIYGRS